MKKNQGNIIIIFVIILLIIIIFAVFSLKSKIQQGWTSTSKANSSVKSPQQNEIKTTSTTVLNTDQPSPTVQNQVDESQFYEYYNDLSVIQNNETLNPFLRELNTQIPNPNTKETTQPNSKNEIQINKSNPNVIHNAPNGYKFPSKTSYLVGYPRIQSEGKLNITISNKIGHSNLAVFLFLKKQFSDQRNIDLNTLLTGIYLNTGDDFTFTKMESGYYRIVWINLANKKTYRSKDFAIFQDNKYAYDRVITFYPNNATSTNDKSTELPLNSLYKEKN